MSITFVGEVIRAIAAPIFSVIDKAVPDKDMAAQLKIQIQSQLIDFDARALDRRADVIIAEAEGGSWLQRSWRPITMLTFTSLIVTHWLGFTAENLPPDQVIALLDIVKIGLGGYVLGRSAEKVAKNWKPNG